MSPTVKSNERWTCEGCGYVVFTVPMAGDNCPRCGNGEFEQRPVQIVCDFCSKPDAPWTFPANDFRMPDVPGAKIQMSRGGWACCDECKPLVEAKDASAIADRALTNERDLHPEMAISFPDALAQLMIAGYRGFFANRTGPARPSEDVEE